MPLLFIAKYSPVTIIHGGNGRLIQSLVAIMLSISLGSWQYSKIKNRFRISTRNSFKESGQFSQSFFLLLSLPVVLMVVMLLGIQYSYWGLDKNMKQPVYAGIRNKSCSSKYQDVPCRYLAPGSSKTVLLIGDSHALHISTALIDAASESNWNALIWTLPSCNFDFERDLTPECLHHNKEIIHFVEHERPSAVIVSQYIHANLSQLQLRMALVKIKLNVPEVLVVENSPVFPDGQEFGLARPIFMKPYLAPKEFPIQKMRIEDKESSSNLASWARENGFSTMQFDSLFCDASRCQRWRFGKWLYSDTNHFSVDGDKLTIPQLKSYLRSL